MSEDQNLKDIEKTLEEKLAEIEKDTTLPQAFKDAFSELARKIPTDSESNVDEKPRFPENEALLDKLY